MHIADILKKKTTSFSYEFFPPKTEEASQKLFQAIENLAPLNPDYVSVTYGAGGSGRDLTKDLIVKIQAETDITVVSHLTCVGDSKDDIARLLDTYANSGIQNILALRGDPPKGEINFQPHPDGFKYAIDLVEFIKKHHPEMGIGVAGFPEGHAATPNRLKELQYLKEKVDAGADYICTQLFFDNRDFYDFKERCSLIGINIPIIAGIMPISTQTGMQRMADLALGARFPAKLLKALARTEDKVSFANVGLHWATEQVLDLVDNNVAGVHFYTLNKSNATKQIYNSIGI